MCPPPAARTPYGHGRPRALDAEGGRPVRMPEAPHTVLWRRRPGTPGWLRRREDGREMTSDPTAFGRVDEDGTVYLKTAAGERIVGSWQAGTPEEGLAHFARRYADLVTEVDLIETRLGSGTADASHSLASIRRLRSGLDEAHVVGDVDGLAARLDKLATIADEKAGAARAARDAARAEAVLRKTSLVEEAEKIAAEATGWKT